MSSWKEQSECFKSALLTQVSDFITEDLLLLFVSCVKHAEKRKKEDDKVLDPVEKFFSKLQSISNWNLHDETQNWKEKMTQLQAKFQNTELLFKCFLMSRAALFSYCIEGTKLKFSLFLVEVYRQIAEMTLNSFQTIFKELMDSSTAVIYYNNYLLIETMIRAKVNAKLEEWIILQDEEFLQKYLNQIQNTICDLQNSQSTTTATSTKKRTTSPYYRAGSKDDEDNQAQLSVVISQSDHDDSTDSFQSEVSSASSDEAETETSRFRKEKRKRY